MSNLTLDHPTISRPEPRRPVRTDARIGSYVDTDGTRRAARRTGSYVSRTSVSPVGSYTDRDGVRRRTGRGSYTRVQH